MCGLVVVAVAVVVVRSWWETDWVSVPTLNQLQLRGQVAVYCGHARHPLLVCALSL